MAAGRHADAELEIGQRVDARGGIEHALGYGVSVRF